MSRLIAVLLLIACAASSASAADIRVKDLSDFEGVQDNALTGFGLVVGLNNTGGKSPITRRLAMNFVQQYGIRIPPDIRAQIRTDTREKTNNISVVVVSARLPAFTRTGQKIDVNVSTFDDAASLTGGFLIPTPLMGVDGEVYAVADGNVSVDSFVAGGQAATVQKNHPTAGRIISGAIVEREVCTTLTKNGRVRILLREPDFETATRMVDVINRFSPQTSRAIDPATIELNVAGKQPDDIMSFLAQIESLKVRPDVRAKVVINERTGTIVIGENVRLSHVLITHANLAIFTKESPEVSQPQPFSDGETVVVPRTEVNAVEEDRPIHEIEETTTVSHLAEALNALGVAPRDLGVIFQQLRDSGALHAELEFK
ncbi:Flagellar P-ring protein precursor [Caulifigura coniformis]|uniref:Flagellar P-ring protein n=1 Tax=Caulifigura coniformis TaxID=2527983 RepID=A0A517SJC9_9PLAN|nr:flagellar basal body P-ring protein FlgI [Caulifigura coniformis]QDT56232.1 Flagellar P-ring protein precursor [Caulifigura coniformis]